MTAKREAIVPMRWYRIDQRQPRDGEYVLVYHADKLGYAFATWYAEHKFFAGSFHGFNPQWWCRLSEPKETK